MYQQKKFVILEKSGQMDNKQEYEKFCEKVYVPIYSKSWWLDAVCGENNWNVWLCEKGKEIVAAMPYFIEMRGQYTYITKPLLTQNNGIIFKYPDGAKKIAKQSFEEKIIDEACEFISMLDVDVYEQQFHYDFRNWLPFFWNRYTEITRYTYVLEDLSDLDEVWQRISSKYRSVIKKGSRGINFSKQLDAEVFYKEHKKIFEKQGLPCPFSMEQWKKIYQTCKERSKGETFYAVNSKGQITSVLFLIWDEKSMYQLLGGNMPEFQSLDTYDALIWEGIKFAAQNGLKYDFEGSVIKRISKSFREFGGEAKPYFRIRKVFNPEILRSEMEKSMKEILGG